MLKNLQLYRFSTESHFPWQLDVKWFNKWICKISDQNAKRLL